MNAEELELSYVAHGNVKRSGCCEKTVWCFLQNRNTELPWNSSIPLRYVLHITEDETSLPDVGTHLRGSILHNRDWKQLGCSLAGELGHCGRSIQWSIMQP